MKKRIFNMLLVLFAVFTIMPMIALAGDNNYTLTEDREAIVKLDPATNTGTIVYQRGTEGKIEQPIYHDNYLYFEQNLGRFQQGLARLNLTTGEKSIIYKAENQFGIPKWEVYGDQIYIIQLYEDNTATIFMCNLDGSDLRETSMAKAADIYTFAIGEDQIYAVGYGTKSPTAIFYSMNMDGTGFTQIFTQYHFNCVAYNIQTISNGYIYYAADAIYQVEGTEAGNFCVRTDGSGREFIDGYSDETISVDGNVFRSIGANLAETDKYGGVTRIDANGQKTVYNSCRNLYIRFLTPLNNDYFLANGNSKTYLVATQEDKCYPISKFSIPGLAVTKDIYKVIAKGGYNGAPYRKSPNGKILGTIPAGTVVEVLNKYGSNWVKVSYNGGEYYVWFDRLKKVK